MRVLASNAKSSSADGRTFVTVTKTIRKTPCICSAFVLFAFLGKGVEKLVSFLVALLLDVVVQHSHHCLYVHHYVWDIGG